MTAVDLIHREDTHHQAKPMSTSPISPALLAAAASFGEASQPLRNLLVNHLVETSPEAVERMAEASLAGHRLMLATDADTPDPQVRLLVVDSEQRVTQIAAIGLFPPSDLRN